MGKFVIWILIYWEEFVNIEILLDYLCVLGLGNPR